MIPCTVLVNDEFSVWHEIPVKLSRIGIIKTGLAVLVGVA
jgi:hypothetical protein